jgi:hypothetical protein
MIVLLARPEGAVLQVLLVGAVWLVVLAGSPILARLVAKPLAKHPSEGRRALVAPAKKFATTLLVTAGLIATLGIISPTSLEPFPTQIVEFLPRLLITVLLLLVGSTLASIVAGVVGLTATKSMGRPQPGLVRFVRMAVTGLIGLLAIGQLGVNTKVLDTLTQAAVFGAVGTVALLCVQGGRELASNISAGRYIRRIVRRGDELEAELASGTVLAVHGATVELQDEDGWVVHVPNRLLLETRLRLRRHEDA